MGLQCEVASAGPYANNLHLAPDNTSSLNFYRSDALPAPNQQCHTPKARQSTAGIKLVRLCSIGLCRTTGF